MASQSFSAKEWKLINTELDKNSSNYGFPKRIYGSVVIGSFNIRKLGSSKSRNNDTWKFLSSVCKQYDLLAVQEVMDDLSGLHKLMELMGPEYALIVSDKTGVYPGDAGLGERLAFIYRWSVVTRSEIASDITFDRSKTLEVLADNLPAINKAYDKYQDSMRRYETGKRKTKPSLQLPNFLNFIRQPYCVGFEINGFPDTKPYQFLAINAHLHYGNFMSDRKQELDALMNWILARVKDNRYAYYPNFLLLGDLNLDFNHPTSDRKSMEGYLKSLNDASGSAVTVNFPFLDAHPIHGIQRTNARLSETFDQIGLFFTEKGLPSHKYNSKMGLDANAPLPDYRSFNFSELFSSALYGKSLDQLSPTEKTALRKKFEHSVSDHLPIWLRLPLPGEE